MDWINQEYKDIINELDWNPTYFEILMDDGSIIKAIGALDENGNGEVSSYLFTRNTFETVDCDKIVKWRKK